MIAGLDANVLCYALDDTYAEHEKVKGLLINSSPDNKIALNPTTIHEAFHVLVFGQKWKPEEAADALKTLLEDPYAEFFNQTRKISVTALNLSVQHKLGGRDALIVANFLLNKIPVVYTHDKELLKLVKITWKNTSLTFKDPLTEG
jgi:predicted nucleic acid-binding protein